MADPGVLGFCDMYTGDDAGGVVAAVGKRGGVNKGWDTIGIDGDDEKPGEEHPAGSRCDELDGGGEAE